MSTHWAVKYIGTPYRDGARGPHFFDCWGILQKIFLAERGIVLAELPGLSAPQTTEIEQAIVQESSAPCWSPVTAPTEGCIVVMGHTSAFHHVGVWIDCDGGKVLHCQTRHNTIVEPLRSLRLRGLSHIKFYQHRLWPG